MKARKYLECFTSPPALLNMVSKSVIIGLVCNIYDCKDISSCVYVYLLVCRYWSLVIRQYNTAWNNHLISIIDTMIDKNCLV